MDDVRGSTITADQLRRIAVDACTAAADTIRAATTRTTPSRPLWKGAPHSRDQLQNALAAGVHWLLARAQRVHASTQYYWTWLMRLSRIRASA